MEFQANEAATWIPFHAAWTMFRNVSEFLYANTIAATRATMMAMTRPMGLALMAALRAHWATVMAPVMAVPATMATFARRTRPWRGRPMPRSAPSWPPRPRR